MPTDTPPFPSPTKTWHTSAQPAAEKVSAKGKNVLVTGGGNTGIGGETARFFAKAGAARIGLLGRREGPLKENKDWIEKNYPNVKVWIQSADVTDEASINGAFKAFAADGKIDTLIHAASVIGPKENLLESNNKDFLDSISTNISAALYVSKAFAVNATDDAHVVAINSWGSHLSVNDAFAAYCVAKLAVYRVWDTLLLAKPSLSVYHTQPGVILTEMNLSIGGAEAFKDIQTDDVTLPASFNLWLSSPDAKFLSGKFLWCNWDIDQLKEKKSELEGSTELNIGIIGMDYKGGVGGYKAK